jgi:hypothetical protein
MTLGIWATTKRFSMTQWLHHCLQNDLPEDSTQMWELSLPVDSDIHIGMIFLRKFTLAENWMICSLNFALQIKQKPSVTVLESATWPLNSLQLGRNRKHQRRSLCKLEKCTKATLETHWLRILCMKEHLIPVMDCTSYCDLIWKLSGTMHWLPCTWVFVSMQQASFFYLWPSKTPRCVYSDFSTILYPTFCSCPLSLSWAAKGSYPSNIALSRLLRPTLKVPCSLRQQLSRATSGTRTCEKKQYDLMSLLPKGQMIHKTWTMSHPSLPRDVKSCKRFADESTFICQSPKSTVRSTSMAPISTLQRGNPRQAPSQKKIRWASSYQ